MPFVEIRNENLLSLKELVKNEEFAFNWSIKSSQNSKTVAAINNGEILGLVEFERRPADKANYMFLIEVAKSYRGGVIAGKLLAYVAKDSLSEGFGGFFFFESKDALIQYYIERFGARIARGRTLFFDEEASKKLIKDFLGGVYNEENPI